MKEIRQPGAHSYVFSRYLEPIATVNPGETVAIYTRDAFEDRVTKDTDIPSKILGNYLNPQTGPIFVEGAEPGDTLAVHIMDIEPTRDWAVSAHLPNFGGLTATNTTRTLNEPLPEKVFIYKLEDNELTYNKRLKFPWRPFLGTIGTAPELEAISALTPADHGGNMDVPDTKPGNTVYLPVRVPGAYFFTGDCHAGQGDGELCGVALEITAKVTLKFELIKGKAIKWPRIESPTELMVVGSARPMEDAARIAYAELIDWMVELGWDQWEAYQALTQIGKLHVGNMVDTYYSLVAKIDKKYALVQD
ncbi:acetamidase [Paenibacillus sp. JMULE4]|uniref:acetamidase/formamidase family protein n=1 Tax=Paenibacillus TaxID=44249 RepID=UPI0008904030|nr:MULTISPECIES: acetamidase/formamidase family protein [Paenibacillus]NTZ20421.1 acetamidase [Paenibacillus sp. JMULE4]GCL73789.1 acetamidase [Paenibacillus naphthalenovorans]SDI53752.1 Acetamidase/formamidase [Paenibacillus naphthalenovorans]